VARARAAARARARVDRPVTGREERSGEEHEERAHDRKLGPSGGRVNIARSQATTRPPMGGRAPEPRGMRPRRRGACPGGQVHRHPVRRAGGSPDATPDGYCLLLAITEDVVEGRVHDRDQVADAGVLPMMVVERLGPLIQRLVLPPAEAALTALVEA